MKYLHHDQFPRSNKYDPQWVFRNEMGPNVLWLTEFLTEKMDLRPGMRVLDMGCGKALSSIFLAKEFGVHVVANDLWIEPSENWERILESGYEESITPIRAEARELPYAERYFDAAICVDSFVYFGQDSGYTDYFTRFIEHGGQFGICQTMLRLSYAEAHAGAIPDYLEKWYEGLDIVYQLPDVDPASLNWTLEDWRSTLEASGAVKILTADTMENGCQNHVRFLNEHEEAGFVYRSPTELADWTRDAGTNYRTGRIICEVR
jgi:cyclopropane fatty-acyl-phospholipid synthase-like methyltransferase